MTSSTYVEYFHQSFCVTHKTETKPSTFVKFIIKFVGDTNFANILSLCLSHNNCLCQIWIYVTNKFKLLIGFVAPTNLITNLTDVQGFVSVL
jgi:predicted restriction endonuclease